MKKKVICIECKSINEIETEHEMNFCSSCGLVLRPDTYLEYEEIDNSITEQQMEFERETLMIGEQLLRAEPIHFEQKPIFSKGIAIMFGLFLQFLFLSIYLTIKHIFSMGFTASDYIIIIVFLICTVFIVFVLTQLKGKPRAIIYDPTTNEILEIDNSLEKPIIEVKELEQKELLEEGKELRKEPTERKYILKNIFFDIKRHFRKLPNWFKYATIGFMILLFLSIPSGFYLLRNNFNAFFYQGWYFRNNTEMICEVYFNISSEITIKSYLDDLLADLEPNWISEFPLETNNLYARETMIIDRDFPKETMLNLTLTCFLPIDLIEVLQEIDYTLDSQEIQCLFIRTQEKPYMIYQNELQQIPSSRIISGLNSIPSWAYYYFQIFFESFSTLILEIYLPIRR